MNAFPAELIQHHYACMLVAGLLPSGNATKASPHSLNATSPVQNVKGEIVKEAAVPAPATSTDYSNTSILPLPSSVFPQLAQDLCEIFTSRGRNTAWDPAKAKSAVFHSILVDHNVRLPPRKTRPTPRTLTAAPPQGQESASSSSLSSAAAALPPQSPLSPLHPSSPLFPDGLIAPIWLRKHRELVPSVFVAFYCLAEHGTAPPPTPPKDGNTDEQESRSNALDRDHVKEDPLERARQSDESVVKAIANRKRILSERGIKLTVVLLTTRAMLESSTLEQRLSFIRRTSQLDTRASLFVLTPVSKEELSEFVSSLQTALYEPAMDYYREHYRRVRRKRTRYPPPASLVTQIFAVATELRGSPIKDRSLSKEGWLARNEYKLATFAELTGALDDAFTHYTAAYQTISSQLLTSTFLLPPRTKRWAEAKVLADTLNFRISKLLLYRNDGDGAWNHFRTHIKRFTDLSQGWGIGEMTFEFWSWLGKQYRLFGDLLELATRDVPGSPLPPFKRSVHFPPMPTMLLHPSHLPTPTANGGSLATSYNSQYGNLAAPNESAVASNAIPAEMCPSPGDCYYIAGICALERWERFQRLLWEEEQNNVSDKREAEAEQNWSSTSLAHEKKIDHAAQAIEVLSRAHEVLKRHRDHRFALFVASKIIDAYIESNQLPLALRFLERTVRSYEQERWPAPLTSQLLKALYCAQQAQDAESEGRALWRLLAVGSELNDEHRSRINTSLRSWCYERTISEEKRPLLLDFAYGDGPLDISFVFSSNKAQLDGRARDFQLRLLSRADVDLAGMPFDRLVLHFQDSEGSTSITIAHEGEKNAAVHNIGKLDMRRDQADISADVPPLPLRWSPGFHLVIEGSVIPRLLGQLCLQEISLDRDGESSFSLRQTVMPVTNFVDSAESDLWCVSSQPVRYIEIPRQNGPRSILDVQRRECRVRIDVQHAGEAYLDESFALRLKMTNEDVVAFEGELDIHILGPPGEVISADEVWSTEGGGSSKVSSLRDLRFGPVSPKASVTRSVSIRCRGHLAPRSIDVVVRTRIVESTAAEEAGTSETVKSITLSVKPVFSTAFSAQWQLYRDVEAAAVAAGTRAEANGNAEVASEQQKDGKERAVEISLQSLAPDDLPFITSLASLNVSLAVIASTSIELLGVDVALDKESEHLRLPYTLDTSDDASSNLFEDVGGIWSHGDRWGGVFDIESICEAKARMTVEVDDGDLRRTGVLLVRWRRTASSGTNVEEQHEENLASLPLPVLLPPHLLSRLIVTLPSSISLEQPLVMLVTVVNPSRLAVDILVAIDDARSDFGNSSHRTISVPNLLPRSTRNVPVQLLPRSHVQMGVSSTRTLPFVRAWQRDRRHFSASTADAISSRRTSIESSAAHAPSAPPMTTSTSGAGRPTALTPIVNHRSGAGVPIDVMLRYTTKSSGITASSSVQNDAEKSMSNTAAIESSNVTNDLNAHLQAESQRTGLWTVFVS